MKSNDSTHRLNEQKHTRLSTVFQICAVGERNKFRGLCFCPQGAHI